MQKKTPLVRRPYKWFEGSKHITRDPCAKETLWWDFCAYTPKCLLPYHSRLILASAHVRSVPSSLLYILWLHRYLPEKQGDPPAGKQTFRSTCAKKCAEISLFCCAEAPRRFMIWFFYQAFFATGNEFITDFCVCFWVFDYSFRSDEKDAHNEFLQMHYYKVTGAKVLHLKHFRFRKDEER